MDDHSQSPPQRGDYQGSPRNPGEASDLVGSNYLPPPPAQPPAYPVTADIPPNSPYHQSPAPRTANRNTAGWLTGLGAALIGFFKYGGLLILKIPALATLLTVLISFAGYAWLRGPWFAGALIVMIFVHEM